MTHQPPICSCNGEEFGIPDLWGIADQVRKATKSDAPGPDLSWVTTADVEATNFEADYAQHHLGVISSAMAHEDSFVGRCRLAAAGFATFPGWSVECQASVAWYSLVVMLENHGYKCDPSWVRAFDLSLIDVLMSRSKSMAILNRCFTAPVPA